MILRNVGAVPQTTSSNMVLSIFTVVRTLTATNVASCNGSTFIPLDPKLTSTTPD
jgi:hypothetical protein